MKTSKNALKHVLHSPWGLLFISSLTHTTLCWVMCLTKRGACFRQVVKNMWQVSMVYGKKNSNAFLFKVYFSYLNGESISKLVISSTITKLTSQRMPSCTSKRYTERLHVFLAVDWKRMMHWQDQSWLYLSAVQKWASGTVYFTLIIPTIITTPQNNDFLHWRRSGWRGFYNWGK